MSMQRHLDTTGIGVGFTVEMKLRKPEALGFKWPVTGLGFDVQTFGPGLVAQSVSLGHTFECRTSKSDRVAQLICEEALMGPIPAESVADGAIRWGTSEWRVRFPKGRTQRVNRDLFTQFHGTLLDSLERAKAHTFYLLDGEAGEGN